MNQWGRVAIAFTVVCGAATASAFAQTPTIDVCDIVTPAKAKAVLKDLAPQPQVKTDHVGFGGDGCMYIGPKMSGVGAQTILSRLTGTDRNRQGRPRHTADGR